ncbi:OpgC domain-containing protein [Paenarthrobacter sp. NPDC092416]|uniref:OpgC domain-containing protein n=1 Tax=Paenarthrobacter sp. NPDC092416 TaxID=3364386 RepID=UPI00380178B3
MPTVPLAAIRRMPAVLVLLLLTFILPTAQAWASAQQPDVKDSGSRFFGALLNWDKDSAADFAQRLGEPAALYGQNVALPMDEGGRAYLKAYFSQVADQGSHALLTVRPGIDLKDISEDVATDFGRQITTAAAGFRGKVFVRFAPEMNAPWVRWGQEPEAYRAAFGTVASALRANLTDPVMVWSPTAEKDYPFREATSTPPKGVPLGSVDTSGNGIWDQDDSAFSPYYPGDEAVDWVGLSVYHDSTGAGTASNTVPTTGEFNDALHASGAGTSSEDFYANYGEARSKPILVETGAFYSPTAGGAAELDVKQTWWQQVFTAVGEPGNADVRAVVWNETTDVRSQGQVSIDWRVTAESSLSAPFRAALDSAGLATGPVTEKGLDDVPGVEVPQPKTGTVIQGWAAWASAGSVLVAVAALWILSSRAFASKWAYTGTSKRDARIDMLRGLAIVFVVVNHVGINSVFQLLSQETLGVVSGAELFVMLSGVVLGMVYGPRIASELGDVVDGTSKRAGKLYFTALAVVLIVYVLSLLPFVNAAAVTTFTDQGTGAAGRAAAGTTYDLYAGMEGLLQFPVPQGLIPALLLLQVGPWQFNIMGLYVVLLLISPLILVALSRGFTWLVLTLSLGLYAAGSIFRFRLLPSQFEDSFPFLVWQLLFVVGMTAGFYRHQIIAWFAAPRQRLLLGACIFLAAACALFSWSGPYLTNQLDVRLALIPESTFRYIYDTFFSRTYLGPGRVLNVILITIALYSMLSAFWKPLFRAVGWFFIPLGQATLYVFIMHVFFIVAIANIPALRDGNLWLNTAVYIALLATLWVMVKTKFLFQLVPR